MEPTFKESDVLIISKNAYWFSDPSKGDVITFNKNGKALVKRIKKIENDSLFVLGDNIDNSIDSRNFGNISKDSVIGKVIIMFNNNSLELVE